MKFTATLVLFCTILSASLLAADKPKKAGTAPSDKKESSGAGMRTWTDKTGKFKVKAKYVESKNGKVTLETSDGKTVVMELEKLSKEDQKLAQKLAKEAGDNPSQVEDENPFDAGVQKKPSVASKDRVEPTLTATDWARVKAIVPDANAGWSLKPDSAPALDKPLTAKPIVLIPGAAKGEKSKLAPFEQVETLLFDRAKGRAFAVFHEAAPIQPPRNRVQRVDLVSGKAEEPIDFPSVTLPDDIDAALGLVVAKSADFHLPSSPPPNVGVWKFSKDDFTHVRSWNTVEAGDFFKAHPGQAKILDADHILTLSYPNKLVVWQVSKARAVYKMDVGHSVALSGNRKYLATALSEGLFFLDPLTGKTLGKLPCGPGPLDAMAFSPDGRQLAGASERRVVAWDLDKGELTHDVLMPDSMIHRNVVWIGKGYLLLGGEWVFDLAKRAVVWRYRNDVAYGYTRGSGEMGGMFWYAQNSQAGDNGCNLFHVQLPHDEVLKAAAALDGDTLLAIRPQAAVSLNVNVQGTPEEQQQVKQALEKELQSLKMTVTDKSPVVVQAFTELGKTNDVTYSGFGPGGGRNKAKVTEQVSRLKIVDSGKTIWEKVQVSDPTPPIIQLKEGQSLQDALAKYQKPNLNFFSTVKMPQYIVRSLEPPGAGSSKLTAQGVQAAPPPRAGAGGR